MATLKIPNGLPIPFTVSMPIGTGLTATNFDECDDLHPASLPTLQHFANLLIGFFKTI